MKKYWVYVHTCNANGKKYVGATTAPKPEYRWGKNGEGYRGQPFEEAILKYGWDNITHEVFEVDSKEEMYRKEIELISFYHSNDPEYGYNCSTGGEKSASGCTRSEECRKRVSETLKKRCSDPEVRKKMSETAKKVHSDPEYRRKLSEAKKGKSHKPHSEEAKRHMAEAAKNRPRIKISLPDGTIVEITKQLLARDYVNKGRKFEYVS